MNGVNETYSRGRRLIVERPLLVVVGLVGVLLVFDFINRSLDFD